MLLALDSGDGAHATEWTGAFAGARNWLLWEERGIAMEDWHKLSGLLGWGGGNGGEMSKQGRKLPQVRNLEESIRWRDRGKVFEQGLEELQK